MLVQDQLLEELKYLPLLFYWQQRVAQIKGKEDVVLFKRRIVIETILKAFTVALVGFIIVIMVTMLLTLQKQGHDFIMYLFEATSAFGTVGLSMGLTPELSSIGRIVIIFTMFAGRLGPLTIAFAITKRRTTGSFPSSKRKYYDWLIKNERSLD